MNGSELGLGQARRHARRRRADLRRWALAHGWSVTERPVVDWGARLPGGDKHGVSVALHGRIESRAAGLGEYSYTETTTTGGATTTTTHQFVVVVLRLDRPSGYVGVQPREVLSRWGHTLFGVGSPIGDEHFDELYRVVGDPAAAAYRLTPALVTAHVRGAIPPWTVYGHDLVTWSAGRIDPAAVPALTGPLRQVAALLTAAGAAG